jgi:hypothetical protein
VVLACGVYMPVHTPRPLTTSTGDVGKCFVRDARTSKSAKKKLPAMPYSEDASGRRLRAEKWPTSGTLKQLVAVSPTGRDKRREEV